MLRTLNIKRTLLLFWSECKLLLIFRFVRNQSFNLYFYWNLFRKCPHTMNIDFLLLAFDNLKKIKIDEVVARNTQFGLKNGFIWSLNLFETKTFYSFPDLSNTYSGFTVPFKWLIILLSINLLTARKLKILIASVSQWFIFKTYFDKWKEHLTPYLIKAAVRVTFVELFETLETIPKLYKKMNLKKMYKLNRLRYFL